MEVLSKIEVEQKCFLYHLKHNREHLKEFPIVFCNLIFKMHKNREVLFDYSNLSLYQTIFC